MIRASLRKYKEKFPLLFLMNALYLFILIFLLIFIKARMLHIITTTQTFGPQIQDLQRAAQQTPTLNPTDYPFLINLEALTTNMLRFLEIYVPIILFLLFFLAQSAIWYYIKGRNDAGAIKLFFMKSLVPSAITILLYMITIIALTKETQWSFTMLLKYGIIFFILFYLLTIAYLTINKQNTKIIIKRFFLIAVKKSYLFMPLLLPLFLAVCLLIFLLWILFLSYTESNFFFFSPLKLILFIVLVVAFSLWYKLYLQEITLKY